MAGLTCDFFKTAGCDRLICMDLHAAQIQGMFAGPFDNLYAIDPLIDQLRRDYPSGDFVIVSPDAGGEKRAQAWSAKLGVPCTFLIKSRDHHSISTINRHELVHKLDFQGKTVVLVDDIGDTIGTLSSAAKIIKSRGAGEVVCCVTHGVFSRNAFSNLSEPHIDRLYTTNTLPQSDHVSQSDKIRVVDVSELCAKAVLACVQGSSMSALFGVEGKGRPS